MRIGIMQPYLLPYIGYFQLLQYVDRFVIYDDIQYTKKGWINRNRFLRNGTAVTFTVPVQKASDYLDVKCRHVAEAYNPQKLLAQIKGAYGKAPFFEQAFPVIEDVLTYESADLFDFLHHGLVRTCAYLDIQTPILVSSSIEPDTGLKGQVRVLSLCEKLGAREYINPIRGLDLYQASAFRERGITIGFMKRADVRYAQFGPDFLSDLSVLDVMMFNTPDAARHLIETGYELVPPHDD